MFIFSSFWSAYAADIAVLCFWVFTALVIFSPLQLITAIYKYSRIGDVYPYEVNRYDIKKQQAAEIIFHGGTLTLIVSVVTILSVLV